MNNDRVWNENKTEEYKKWFKKLDFHYHITIGMKPNMMIKKYSLQKHLDYLEFRLNKLLKFISIRCWWRQALKKFCGTLASK